MDGDSLELQDGVTNICHIIDKSEALIPWACKQMAIKILNEAPIMALPTGERLVRQMTYQEFETLVLTGKTAHKEKLEEAGQVGHVAHAWIEEYIKSVLTGNEERKMEFLSKFPLDERARNCCFAALDWMKRHNVRWLGTERKIYSRKHKYAGTMDGICIVDSCADPKCCPIPFVSRLTITDWKTSNYLYMEYLLQTAAYLQAYNEESLYVDPQSTPAVDRWVIRLGKDDGEFETWHAPVETFAEDFNGFLTALALKRSVESIKSRIKLKTDCARAVLKAERKAAKEAADAAEKERKALEKAEKKTAQEQALRLKCKRADKYQGKRKPTCGCETCLAKYAEVQASKTVKVKADNAKKPKKTADQQLKGQFTIGQWADCVNRNYTGLITHTSEKCDCGTSDEILAVPKQFDPDIGLTYIDTPVCERCHSVRTSGQNV